MKVQFLNILMFMVFFFTLAIAEDNAKETAANVDATTNKVQRPESVGISRIAVLDIQSSSLTSAQTGVLSDIFRTELFKTGIFQIVEQSRVEHVAGAINQEGITSQALEKLAAQLNVTNIMVMNLERFGEERLVLNVRIIQVPGLVLVYSENFFLPNEDLLFETLIDLTAKVQNFYLGGDDTSGDDHNQENERWLQLGANREQIETFMTKGIEPDTYITLRQYDISFDMNNFSKAVEANWDLNTLRQFFQAEISYYLAERAFNKGIFSMDHYRSSFRPKGFSFSDYMDAYEKNIITPAAYQNYIAGYSQDNFLLGLGGVANDLPIGNADFSYPLMQLGWEHFWTHYQRDLWKTSTEVGLYFLLIAPTPYIQGNYYIGKAPYYFKFGLGAAAEVLLGGHVGMYTRMGFEVMERFEVSMISTWFGTNPKVSYTDFETKKGEDGYVGLTFPYFGVLFSYKISSLRQF